MTQETIMFVIRWTMMNPHRNPSIAESDIAHPVVNFTMEIQGRNGYPFISGVLTNSWDSGLLGFSAGEQQGHRIDWGREHGKEQDPRGSRSPECEL